jgi:hypothetical protein
MEIMMRTTIRRGTSLLAAVTILSAGAVAAVSMSAANPATPNPAAAAAEASPGTEDGHSSPPGTSGRELMRTAPTRATLPTPRRCVTPEADRDRNPEVATGSTPVDRALYGSATPPAPAPHCTTGYGDLPPAGDIEAELARLGESIDVWIARLEAERLEAERLEAERLEAERVEAERREAARRQAARQAARTAPTRPGSGSGGGDDGDGDWYDMGEQGDTVQGIPGMCEINCTPGATNDIPPKPEGCTNGHYDTAWGGWLCANLQK